MLRSGRKKASGGVKQKKVVQIGLRIFPQSENGGSAGMASHNLTTVRGVEETVTYVQQLPAEVCRMK